MECPICKENEDKVIDSREIGRHGHFKGIRRRRECIQCSYRWTTYEYPPGFSPGDQELARKMESLKQLCKSVMNEIGLMEAREAGEV